jgi:hypothetical protein
MTSTAAADAVMPACARTAAACSHTATIVTSHTAFAATGLACRGPVQRAARGFAGARVACHGPDAFPTAARGSRRHLGRPGHARPPRLRCLVGLPRQREPRCVRRLHLLRADLATLGWPSETGRDGL